jgi:hypothetical protein
MDEAAYFKHRGSGSINKYMLHPIYIHQVRVGKLVHWRVRSGLSIGWYPALFRAGQVVSGNRHAHPQFTAEHLAAPMASFVHSFPAKTDRNNLALLLHDSVSNTIAYCATSEWLYLAANECKTYLNLNLNLTE